MLRTTDQGWWHAVGAPFERRVRAHWLIAAAALEFHDPDSGGAEALRQAQSRFAGPERTAAGQHEGLVPCFKAQVRLPRAM